MGPDITGAFFMWLAIIAWFGCSSLGYLCFRSAWKHGLCYTHSYTIGDRCFNIMMSILAGPVWFFIMCFLWIVIVVPDYIPIDFSDEAKW